MWNFVELCEFLGIAFRKSELENNRPPLRCWGRTALYRKMTRVQP
ncbi:hypothetical protein [Klebsiella phage vB_KpnS-VAC35]|uniref:Uncharacterized protein n=1 Tax=Klebsiella phage vB_KpnS-VAC35 TaxID=2866696 RepID=A0AAE9C604_9CAUD|nr:hypothetical protein [Klebsiella phage vB_KpnS-VAC35]